MKKYLYQVDQNIKVVESVDVLIVGGGFGGICAALSASRAGRRTALVEKNALLGGQAAEIDTWGLDGFVSRDGHLVVAGYPWEILWKIVKEGGSDTFFDKFPIDIMEKDGIEAALQKAGLKEYVPYIQTGTFMNPFNDQYVNPNAYRYVAACELEKAGVSVFLGMPVVDVIMEDTTANGVVIQGEFEKFAILAERVVDTTQGASVCALAGKIFAHPKAYVGTLPRIAGVDIHRVIDYIRNTEDEWFLRPMVGTKADPDIMESLVNKGNPLAIHGFTKALNQAVKEYPEYELIKRMGKSLMFFYERDTVGAYWAIDDVLNQTDVSDPVKFSEAILTERKQQWLVHKFFVNYVPGFENAHLLDTYANISKAYHQSLEPSGFTEYNITEKEIQSGNCEREDYIVKILGHPMSGQNAGGWYIPLAALTPKGLDNILVTGKPACRKIHYIASCALVGQAAGAAAAESLIEEKSLRETDPEEIRKLLRKQGVLI